MRWQGPFRLRYLFRRPIRPIDRARAAVLGQEIAYLCDMTTAQPLAFGPADDSPRFCGWCRLPRCLHRRVVVRAGSTMPSLQSIQLPGECRVLGPPT